MQARVRPRPCARSRVLTAQTLPAALCWSAGDLQKWADAQVREVVGVDLSPKEIEEAKRRYRQLRVPRPPLRSPWRTLFARVYSLRGCPFSRKRAYMHPRDAHARAPRTQGRQISVDWQQSDVLGLTSPILFGPGQTAEAFDSVTSMFALHYFFASETSLRHLLTTAAANLRPGGYFYGVCPDGARVEVRALSCAYGLLLWNAAQRPVDSCITCRQLHNARDTTWRHGSGQ